MTRAANDSAPEQGPASANARNKGGNNFRRRLKAGDSAQRPPDFEADSRRLPKRHPTPFLGPAMDSAFPSG
jgi:hypothetical protein